MNAALRHAIQQLTVDALDPDAALGREGKQFLHASTAALTDADGSDASGAQCLEHRIYSVNDHSRLSAAHSHREGRRTFASARNAPKSCKADLKVGLYCTAFSSL
jgi:hypothetical protein